MRALKLAGVVFVTLLLMSCGEGELSIEYPRVGPDNLQTIASELRPDARRERAMLIRDAARDRGLENGALLAGIADVETNLAHCWSEARWACQGPASSSCGGGPVIAGSADGPCSARQGGLGMFQFDGGTYSQTLSREGRGILTIEGNTRAAVEFVVDKVRISDFISGVSSESDALAWMNRLRPDTPEWNQWILTVTGYYNGCFEGRCSKFNSQYNKYDTRTRAVLNEFGPEFWGASSGASDPGGSSSSQPPASGRPSVATDLMPATAEVSNGGSLTTSWYSVGATRYSIRAEYYNDGQWRHYWEWERNAAVFEVWPQVSNTAYRWSVKACNANGCADWSPYATFNVGSAVQPGSGSSADNSGNTGSSTDNTDSSADNTGSSTGNTGSGSNTDNSGNTGSGTDNTGSTSQTSRAPGMPASMSPAGVYIETPDVPLSWSQPADGESYDIVMYFYDGSDWADYYVWEGKSGGSFTVWPVVDETYYAWAIRACNADGCSDWSDFQQFYFGGL